MPTLREFLEGETLTYEKQILTTRKKKRVLLRKEEYQATYRAGVGIIIERGEEMVGTADVTDDLGATRVFWNLTR